MKVLVAEKCGFCPGVRAAINLAQKTLTDDDRVYSLGHIIHNEDMVNQLSEAGLSTVESIETIGDGFDPFARGHAGGTGPDPRKRA